MADTPSWSGPVPVLFTGAWQTKQYQAGLPGGINETVFDAVNDPSAEGLAAAHTIPSATITRD